MQLTKLKMKIFDILNDVCHIFTKVYANIFPHNTRLIDTIIASRQADADREIVNSN